MHGRTYRVADVDSDGQEKGFVSLCLLFIFFSLLSASFHFAGCAHVKSYNQLSSVD